MAMNTLGKHPHRLAPGTGLSCHLNCPRANTGLWARASCFCAHPCPQGMGSFRKSGGHFWQNPLSASHHSQCRTPNLPNNSIHSPFRHWSLISSTCYQPSCQQETRSFPAQVHGPRWGPRTTDPWGRSSSRWPACAPQGVQRHPGLHPLQASSTAPTVTTKSVPLKTAMLGIEPGHQASLRHSCTSEVVSWASSLETMGPGQRVPTEVHRRAQTAHPKVWAEEAMVSPALQAPGGQEQ